MDKLIKNLSARFPDLTEEDIVLSVETIIRAMSSSLVNGKRIELRGFGSFNLHASETDTSKKMLLGRESFIATPPRIIFKPGQIIRERVNKLHYSE